MDRKIKDLKDVVIDEKDQTQVLARNLVVVAMAFARYDATRFNAKQQESPSNPVYPFVPASIPKNVQYLKELTEQNDNFRSRF